MTQPTTEHLQSAIIGYWRSGATIEEIKNITGMSPIQISEIILLNQKQLLLNGPETII